MKDLKISESVIPDLNSEYRAVVIDAEELEFAEGVTFLRLEYLVFDSKSSSASLFTEEISDVSNNPRSKEFFGFLNRNHVSFVDAADLKGLVFDANLTIEIYQNVPYLKFSNRSFVAKPLRQLKKDIEDDDVEDITDSFWC